MTRWILRLPLLSLALLLPPVALPPVAGAAATMQFDVRGACNYKCGVLGVAEGGAMTGRVRVDDSTFFAGGTVDDAALVSYQFRMGSFRFSNADVADPGFYLTWGNRRDSVEALQISAFVSHDRDRPAPALEVYFTPALHQAILTNDGYQWRGEFASETSFGDAAYTSVDSVRAAPIPLPAAAWLVIAGSGALVVAGRRRRAQA